MSTVAATTSATGGAREARRRIGVGVIGFGWLGQAHSRSLLRIPTLFPDRTFEPELVVCSDPVAARVEDAVGSFGFARGADDWRRVMDDPDVDVVYIAAPNMVHIELVEAAAQAGKHVFCEKPVGGTPEQTVRAERAARRAGVISGVGYNYRWAPLVRYARELIDTGRARGDHELPRPLLLHVRQRPARSAVLALQARRGRPRRHERPAQPRRRPGAHAARADHARGRHDGDVHPASGRSRCRAPATTAAAPPATRPARSPTRTTPGCCASSRAACAGRSRRAGRSSARRARWPSTSTARSGAAGWNLEKLNELRLYRLTDDLGSGYTTVFGGDRFPYHGNFVPGSANGIGFEDLVVIEDYEFCRSIAEGRPHSPGFEEALAWVSVQAALLKSVRERTAGSRSSRSGRTDAPRSPRRCASA